MPKYITDEEMSKLEAAQVKKPKYITDEEMSKLEAEESKKGVSQEQEKIPYDMSSLKGLLGSNPIINKFRKEESEANKKGVELIQTPLEIAGGIGSFVDKYTGAPVRSAISAIQNKQSPLDAYINQFGEDAEKAPTGKQIAEKSGFSSKSLSDVFPSLYSKNPNDEYDYRPSKGGLLDVSPSGVAGLGVDVLADPTNLIPLGLAAKEAGTIGKAGGTLAKDTAKGLIKGGAAATDLLTGSEKATGLLKTASNAVEMGKDLINKTFSPKVSEKFKDYAAIAEKHGIDPKVLSSQMEFGKGSTIERLEKSLREGATGEKLFDEYNRGLSSISEAFDNSARKISGKNLVNEIDAGNDLVDSFSRAKDAIFNNEDLVYSDLSKYHPGGYINKDNLVQINSQLNGIEKRAKTMMKNAIDDVDKAQAKYLMNAVDGIRRSGGNFKQFIEQMQNVGRKAFPERQIIGQIPPDIKEMKGLYSKMKDAVIGTVEKDINPAFATELKANNQKIHEFLNLSEPVKDILESGEASEKVWSKVLGDSKKIESLKNVLGPEDFNQVKKSFLSSVVKRGEDGVINFQGTINAFNKNKNKLASLFSPKEIQDFTEILSLGKEYGGPVLSTSGTGASNSFRDFASQVFRGARDEELLKHLKDKARGNLAKEMIEKQTPKKGLLDTLKQNASTYKRGNFDKATKAAQSLSSSGLLNGYSENE